MPPDLVLVARWTGVDAVLTVPTQCLYLHPVLGVRNNRTLQSSKRSSQVSAVLTSITAHPKQAQLKTSIPNVQLIS